MASTITKRKQFTTDEYHRMGETGILHEDDRVELIEGEIIEMTPIGLRHSACVKRLNNLFTPLMAAKQTLISVQDPLFLDEHNEPQPDIILLNYREDFYENKQADAKDALLVIEVAESSLHYDVNVKIPLYARSFIHELWLVDLQSNSVQTYHSSNGEAFHEKQRNDTKQSITPLAFPEHPISVQSIFGMKSDH